MADTCTFPSDRNERLVSYLYDDIEPAARAAFEAHMTSCEVCRNELEALQGVRHQLAAWAPPVANPIVHSSQSTVDRIVSSEVSTVGRQLSTVDRRPSSAGSWLPDIPAWAQVAAAILIFGVAAGIANLDVRYDKNGLSVRTGWSKPARPAAGTTAPVSEVATRTDVVSHTELVALEQRIRDEVRALQTSAHAVAASDAQPTRGSTDADVMRRVRALLDEGEKRQQRELALRVGEVIRDVNAQRQADLMRIDRSLGLVQNDLGVEVLKQRERVNYLMRVNQPR